MTDYDRCRICGERAWLRTHKCKPEWDVLCPDWTGDDPYTVRARRAEDAAEAWGERYDEERHLADGSSVDVLVREAGTDGPWKSFRVYGEATVLYYAVESKEISPEVRRMGEDYVDGLIGKGAQ